MKVDVVVYWNCKNKIQTGLAKFHGNQAKEYLKGMLT